MKRKHKNMFNTKRVTAIFSRILSAEYEHNTDHSFMVDRAVGISLV